MIGANLKDNTGYETLVPLLCAAEGLTFACGIFFPLMLLIAAVISLIAFSAAPFSVDVTGHLHQLTLAQSAVSMWR